ncbi:Putative CAMK/CAMKL/KIN1 protein kinase [Rhizopus microsporus]|nr:Putative CAMK/CAMKL/KIN1 protein kinase [Rhizopus microsporus]
MSITIEETIVNESQDIKRSLSRRQSERHQVMKVQNYVIYRKTIGAGSMGKVKLAECLTDPTKQKYAVKIMPKIDLQTIKSTSHTDPKDTPQEREQRTIREMAIMRLLRHPNICQLKEYITEGDKYYMFLEYVDGGQLLDYIIKHGKLKEKQARKFARQIVSALDYCHRNSIVHRDLKIENILITKSEQIKIIDFGLSNVYHPTQQLNTFCGSLYFAAPELLKAKEYTGPEVDIWSFGVVLYVLVCGKVPFDDTNLPALHEKIKSGIVDDYPDHLGKDCLDLLTKIFVVNPKQRITLSAIRSHPWINKGYDEPINNYLPHRQPLETIDMTVVEGMQGFGLGTPDEIRSKLEMIISSSEYQSAATKIDENYQRKITEDQVFASRPRWRRRLSSSSRIKHQAKDDFQTLPAMYDPLISVYYLVKERKEAEERKRQLLDAPQTSLTRSTSTHETKPSSSSSPALARRQTIGAMKRSTSTSTVRQKSEASKKISSQTIDTPTTPAEIKPQQKPHWLKLEFNQKSYTSKQQSRTSFTSTASTIRRPSWKRLSFNHKSGSNDNSSPDVSPPPFKTLSPSSSFREPALTNSKSESTKSLFDFLSRGHFYRLTQAEIKARLLDILDQLSIDVTRCTDHALDCVFEYPVWSRFVYRETQENSERSKQIRMPLRFTILVYSARWSSHKTGFRIQKDDEQMSVTSFYTKEVFKNLYRTLVDRMDKLVH